ncbi:hypothetical protein RI367_003921 [Sorochytrium milnesiophthora]
MATPQRPHPRERWMTPPGAKSPSQSVAAADAEEYEQQHYTPRRRRQSRSAAPAPPSASSAFPTSMVRGRSRRRRRYMFRALPGGVAVPDGGEPATLAFPALPYTAATKSRQSARYAHMWRFKVVSAPGEDKCEGVAVFRIDEQSLYWAPVPEGAAAFSAVPSLRGYSSEWVDDADTLSYELVDDCALVVVVDIGKLAGVGDAYLTLLHFQLITQAGIFVLQAHTLDDKRAFLSTLQLIRQEIDWLLPPAHDQQSSSGLEHEFEPVDFSRVWQDLVAFQERMIQAEERFIELQHGIDSRLEAIAECADNINSLAVDEQELLATVRGHYISSEADFTTRLTQHARNADSAAAQVHGFGQRVKDVAQQVETYKCEANELLDGNSRTGRRSAPSKIIHTGSTNNSQQDVHASNHSDGIAAHASDTTSHAAATATATAAADDDDALTAQYESDDEEIKTRRRRWEETKVQIIKQQQLRKQKQQQQQQQQVSASSSASLSDSAAPQTSEAPQLKTDTTRSRSGSVRQQTASTASGVGLTHAAGSTRARRKSSTTAAAAAATGRHSKQKHAGSKLHSQHQHIRERSVSSPSIAVSNALRHAQVSALALLQQQLQATRAQKGSDKSRRKASSSSIVQPLSQPSSSGNGHRAASSSKRRAGDQSVCNSEEEEGHLPPRDKPQAKNAEQRDEAEEEEDEEDVEGHHAEPEDASGIGMPTYLVTSRSTIPAQIQPPYPKLPATFKTPATSSKYDFVKVHVHLPPPAPSSAEQAGSSEPPSSTYSYVLSRFLTSRFLTATRIPSHHAVRIALDVKKRLVDRNQLSLSQQELEQELFVLMRRWGYGEFYVRCYRLLSRFHQLRVPLIVLIGGTKCLGKAALATRLAERLNLPSVLKTEVVAELMKSIVYKSAMQEQVWLRPFSTDSDFINEWRSECELVRKGLHTDIEKCLKEGKSMIIEGPHINQELIEYIHGLVASSTGAPSPTSSQQQQQQSSASYVPPAIVIPFLITLEDEQLHRQFVGDWTDMLCCDLAGGGAALALSADDLFRRLRILQDILMGTYDASKPIPSPSMQTLSTPTAVAGRAFSLSMSPAGSPLLPPRLSLSTPPATSKRFIAVPLETASLVATLENMHTLVLERLYAAFFVPQSPAPTAQQEHEPLPSSSASAPFMIPKGLLSPTFGSMSRAQSEQPRSPVPGSHSTSYSSTLSAASAADGHPDAPPQANGVSKRAAGPTRPLLHIPMPSRRNTDSDACSPVHTSAYACTSPSTNTSSTSSSSSSWLSPSTASSNGDSSTLPLSPSAAFALDQSHYRHHTPNQRKPSLTMARGSLSSSAVPVVPKRGRVKSEVGLDEQRIEDEIRKAMEKTALRKA